MGLKLKPRNRRVRRKLRPYTIRTCPFVGFQVSWCRGICKPINGYGQCGRLAPHAMLDRTQRAIAAYNARKRAEKLADQLRTSEACAK